MLADKVSTTSDCEEDFSSLVFGEKVRSSVPSLLAVYCCIGLVASLLYFDSWVVASLFPATTTALFAVREGFFAVILLVRLPVIGLEEPKAAVPALSTVAIFVGFLRAR